MRIMPIQVMISKNYMPAWRGSITTINIQWLKWTQAPEFFFSNQSLNKPNKKIDLLYIWIYREVADFFLIWLIERLTDKNSGSCEMKYTDTNIKQ